MPMQVTQSEFARFTGLGKSTLRKYATEGMPVIAVGRGGRSETALESVEALEWIQRMMTEREIAKLIEAGDYDKDQELGRLRFHQANIAQMDEGQRKGELLIATEVQEAWVNIVMQVRSTLLAMPVRLAQVAYSGASMREIEAAARQEIEAVLNRMADNANKYYQEPDELQPADDAEASADTATDEV